MAKNLVISLQGQVVGKERRPHSGSNLRQRVCVAAFWDETRAQEVFSAGINLRLKLIDYPTKELDRSSRQAAAKVLKHQNSVPYVDSEIQFEQRGGDRHAKVPKNNKSFFASNERKIMKAQSRRNQKDRQKFF